VFTHGFVAAVRRASTATLDQVLTIMGTSLNAYEMHPVAEGSVKVRAMPYASSDTRGGARSQVARSPRRIATLWEHCWSVEVFGQRGDACVELALEGSELVAHVRTHLLGGGEWRFTVSGDTLIGLDLAFGIKLRFSVRDWKVVAGILHCYIALDLVSAFFPAISIGGSPVMIVLSPAERRLVIDEPRSAAEMLALVNLQAAGTQLVARGQGTQRNGMRAAGDVVPMAWGDEGWGPNWREERAVHPSERARAVKRTGVRFDPVRGGGWVEFRGWLSDDERDPGFTMHIGNGFFGGWGSVHYTVEGVYEVDDPFPLRAAPGLLGVPAAK
jgi:hypothetical protein